MRFGYAELQVLLIRGDCACGQQSKLIRDTTDQKVKSVENDANLITQTAAAKASLVLTKAKSRVQAENNKAELFLLEAALTRKQTEKEVAALTNDAMKVLQVAEANANKTKAVAENTLMETVDRARAQGLKNISQTLADHGVNLEAKHKASLDYMINLALFAVGGTFRKVRAEPAPALRLELAFGALEASGFGLHELLGVSGLDGGHVQEVGAGLRALHTCRVTAGQGVAAVHAGPKAAVEHAQAREWRL